MKIYIVYCDYRITSGNHAGMGHLVDHLDKEIHEIIPILSLTSEFWHVYIAKLYSITIAFYLSIVLRKDDKVFLFEYLTRYHGYQEFIAKILRLLGKRNVIYALTHLSESHLIDMWENEETIKKHLSFVDKIFVFGSTLANYLREMAPQKEVVTTFHYVDTNYYKPIEINCDTLAPLKVICIGNLKRNFPQLIEIIKQSNETIQFHVCAGKSSIEIDMRAHQNVHLYGYLREDALLKLMQECDVSLSVMEDTIGSNAITTCLAVGLVQVVSNVGSIKDYCDNSNSFMCNSTLDFLKSLDVLNRNRNILIQMKQNALTRADELSIKAFIKEFKAFFI